MLKPKNFTVGFVDVSPYYQAKIITLVESLAEDEGFPWMPLSTDGCDLLIASTEALVSPQSHQIVARILDEGETAFGLTLRVPITRVSLIELLNEAEQSLLERARGAGKGLQVKRLQSLDGSREGSSQPKKQYATLTSAVRPDAAQAFANTNMPSDGAMQMGQSEVHGNTPSPSAWRQRLNSGGEPQGAGQMPPVNPPQDFAPASPQMPGADGHMAMGAAGAPGQSAWTEVALTLYSLMQNNAQAIAEISIAGTETVNIDFRFRAYQSTAEIEWLPSEPMFTSIRTVQAEPNWPPAFALPAKPLDAFLWFVGFNAFSGGPAPWLKPEERYRLQRWPNFTEINHTMEDMRMTALLGNTYMNAFELATAAGAKIDAANRLLNAYSLIGLLQVSVEKNEAAAPVPAKPAEDKAKSSLFSRLFKKLGS
jgi:hypothetical protein